VRLHPLQVPQTSPRHARSRGLRPQDSSTRYALAYHVIAPNDLMSNIVAIFGAPPAGRHLALNGHMDLFPLDATGWTVDPWGGELIDGKIFGRGACDMKCGTTASLFTFLHLYELRTPCTASSLSASSRTKKPAALGRAVSGRAPSGTTRGLLPRRRAEQPTHIALRRERTALAPFPRAHPGGARRLRRRQPERRRDRCAHIADLLAAL
jgi:Peptidase family M20/M25/M40